MLYFNAKADLMNEFINFKFIKLDVNLEILTLVKAVLSGFNRLIKLTNFSFN